MSDRRDFGGIPVKLDPTVPKGEVELRDLDGQTIARITGIGDRLTADLGEARPDDDLLDDEGLGALLETLAAQEPPRKPGRPPKDPVPSIDELSVYVLKELFRRLRSPKERAGLSSTGLLQLARELLKAKQAEGPPPDASGPVDVLEMIRTAKLPDGRKKDLLRHERTRLRARLRAVEELLG